MGIFGPILQHFPSLSTEFYGVLASLIITIAMIVFRGQLVRLLSMLPQPLVELLFTIPILGEAIGRSIFQDEFGEQVKRAKARAKGVEESVAGSRAMPTPNRLNDPEKQPTRDLVLAAWGALQQNVYDACTASNLPLTPATRIPEAVRRLGEAHAITAELAHLLDVLYRLGQELADDTGLRPRQDDARVYTELADLVVDWMMINILSRRKEEEANRRPEPKPQPKTLVGGHFPPPQLGYPVAVLVGIGGPLRGQRFSIEKEYYRIGSNADNDLRITGDAYVSGNHASIRYEQGSLFLADQGSRNGSFLNDKRVAGSPVVVRRGDHLRLGESVFQVAGVDPQVSPVKESGGTVVR
jgi:pSer/pThr/pTyr-binding forkhead associated (FHA) protein